MTWITMVGSRSVHTLPYQHLLALATVAVRDYGFGIRSGGAAGCDEAAARGAECGVAARQTPGSYLDSAIPADQLAAHLRVFLPFDGFRQQSAARPGYIDASRLPLWHEAQAMALDAHPNPAALKLPRNAFALAAHTRNVFQILGENLNCPSRLLVCWSKPDAYGDATGGTRTAWMLAKSRHIPVYNLAIDTPALIAGQLARLSHDTPH